MPEIESSPWPERMSTEQRTFWARWLLPDLGQDERDRWYGYCPMHQPELCFTDTDPLNHPEAKFDFVRGTWWCLDDEPCTLPKKAGTLVKLSEHIKQVIDAAF